MLTEKHRESKGTVKENSAFTKLMHLQQFSKLIPNGL